VTVTPKFTGFIGTPDGERRLVEGEEWADDDPFVVANPDAFTNPGPDPTYAHDAHCNTIHRAGPEPCPPARSAVPAAPKPPRASTRRETKP
jgi:hypothetical protein